MPMVLVVDDSPLMRQALRLCLEAEGFRTAEADDGLRGLELLEREGGDVDLCLVDVNMPGLDGLGMVAEARRRGFLRPMVMLTTETSRALRDRGRAAGATAWLTKPVEPPDLVETIRHLLGSARS